MKNIANIITTLRIILSIVLLKIEMFSFLFFTIYIMCGVSDFLDGYIARKMNMASKFGSRLDSIADICLVISMFIIMLPVINISKYIVLWILIIVLVRITSIIIVICKYNTFAILHTYGNKLSGFMLFCLPLAYNIMNTNLFTSIVCVIASISAIEEVIIHILSKELKIDISSIIEVLIHKFVSYDTRQ
ncbi:CDP-alcohol phosphatidyltransferase family protein [Clostridioides difficile]|nr:CDP-alcohol phosphatidyltransferase family protein [Clostridioides difficile]